MGCTYTHAKCAHLILHPPVCPTQLIGMPTSCCMVGYVAARGSVARPQSLSTLTESEGAGMAQRGCPLRGVSADSFPGLNSKPPESALLPWKVRKTELFQKRCKDVQRCASAQLRAGHSCVFKGNCDGFAIGECSDAHLVPSVDRRGGRDTPCNSALLTASEGSDRRRLHSSTAALQGVLGASAQVCTTPQDKSTCARRTPAMLHAHTTHG